MQLRRDRSELWFLVDRHKSRESKSKSQEKQEEATTYGEEVYDVSTVSQIRAISSSPVKNPGNLDHRTSNRTAAPPPS
jgi:hypothetical protein